MCVRDEEEAAEGPKDEEEVQDVEAEDIVTDRLYNEEWGWRKYIGVVVPLWLEFGAEEAEVGEFEVEIEEDWRQKRHVGDKDCAEPE